MKDSGVGLNISRTDDGKIKVDIDVTYNFAISFQKTWYCLKFIDEKFKHFQECLQNGVKSWHGESTIWQANKMFIQKQNHPNNYRNVRLYRRFFILGFNIVPTMLPQQIVRGIVDAKV
jgi:hypothetical protein